MCNIPLPGPHHHNSFLLWAGLEPRDSDAGGGRSNKERQKLQPLECLFLSSGEWGLHTALTGIHPLHIESEMYKKKQKKQ